MKRTLVLALFGLLLLSGCKTIVIMPMKRLYELLWEHRFYIAGFLLLDREGTILSSSNGVQTEDYLRDCHLSAPSSHLLCKV